MFHHVISVTALLLFAAACASGVEPRKGTKLAHITAATAVTKILDADRRRHFLSLFLV
jgi:hypothetical protein